MITKQNRWITALIVIASLAVLAAIAIPMVLTSGNAAPAASPAAPLTGAEAEKIVCDAAGIYESLACTEYIQKMSVAAVIQPTPMSSVGVSPSTPVSVSPVGATPIISTYVVTPGDSASAIAFKFGVSLEDLAKANPQIADLNFIFEGQTINLPQQGVVAQSGSADTGVYGKEDVTQKWENLPPQNVSGGNVVQRGEFWQFADSFLRVIKTENGETSWSSLIKVDGWNPSMPSVINGVSFYWPEDYVFTGQGNGTVTFTMKADNTEGGYDYAASYGDTGKLSLYVTGINGKVSLSKDNGATWKEFDLSSGKPGIDFPKGSTVMFKIVLGTSGGEGMYTLSIGPQDSTGDAPAY